MSIFNLNIKDFNILSNYAKEIAKNLKNILINEIKSSLYIFFEVKSQCKYENNSTQWRLPNGKLHRLDGPALECKYGNRYFINGEELIFEDFWFMMRYTKYSESIISNILGSKSIRK